MPRPDLAGIQAGALQRMDRAERNMRMAIIAAASLEAALFALSIYLIDWSNRGQTLLFVFAVLLYTIIVLGMIALGAHVTRSVGRVLAALDSIR